MRMNNPARGELIVEIPEEMAPIVHGVPKATTGQFLLLDQQGRPIISEPFSGYTHRVDVSQVHLGLYFVRMRIGNTILTEKVVIIR
ncbi:MAG TPA: T9SS type A sorting domain-containing protein [Saprospiraceae bacterium]|nr:T9SS type A sorting domain-containing protein [Saprospiraceae bacterium]